MQLPATISQGEHVIDMLSSREGRALNSSSLSGKGSLRGDFPPGRRDFGPFSWEGRSLKKGSRLGGHGPVRVLLGYRYN